MKNMSTIFRAFNPADIARFNASLPIVIIVRKKLSNAKYLLQIGNKTLQTTSYKVLKVGEKYWGTMQETTDGAIVLNNLLHRPAILDYIPFSPQKFSFDEVEKFLDSTNVFKHALDTSLQQMANAKSKEEFEFLSFVVLGLKEGVLSFVINEGKESLLQIKKHQNTLIFSVIMPHLAIIEGHILQNNAGAKILLKTSFENSLAIFKANIAKLAQIASVEFLLDKNVKPLFMPQGENLLSYLA